MIKYSGLMYCFELDNTICDCEYRNKSFIDRNIKLLKRSVCVNPSSFDIRWTVITSRPKIDKYFIKLYCYTHGLSPCDIITFNGLSFPKYEEIGYQYKLMYFQGVLNERFSVKYTKSKVTCIFNISNNVKENDYINMNKGNYPIISSNSLDFERQFFNGII